MFESAISIVAICVKESYITNNMLTIKAYKSSNRVPGVSGLVYFLDERRHKLCQISIRLSIRLFCVVIKVEEQIRWTVNPKFTLE